jgi:hypothetical protein
MPDGADDGTGHVDAATLDYVDWFNHQRLGRLRHLHWRVGRPRPEAVPKNVAFLASDGASLIRQGVLRRRRPCQVQLTGTARGIRGARVIAGHQPGGHTMVGV